MTKYRARFDDTQWICEKFEPGGEDAKRGRTAGQPKAARWILVGYQPNIKHVCRSLLHDLIGDEVPTEQIKDDEGKVVSQFNRADFTDGCNAVLEAVERAEARIFAAVESMPDPKTVVFE